MTGAFCIIGAIMDKDKEIARLKKIIEELKDYIREMLCDIRE
jgi:hypothetical protein